MLRLVVWIRIIGTRWSGCSLAEAGLCPLVARFDLLVGAWKSSLANSQPLGWHPIFSPTPRSQFTLGRQQLDRLAINSIAGLRPLGYIKIIISKNGFKPTATTRCKLPTDATQRSQRKTTFFTTRLVQLKNIEITISASNSSDGSDSSSSLIKWARLHSQPTSASVSVSVRPHLATRLLSYLIFLVARADWLARATSINLSLWEQQSGNSWTLNETLKLNQLIQTASLLHHFDLIFYCSSYILS